MSTLSPHTPRIINRRNSFDYLITASKEVGGLGYCCVPFFFTKFAASRSGTIAARLGCVTRTVRRWRQMWRAGELPKCKRCADV